MKWALGVSWVITLSCVVAYFGLSCRYAQVEQLKELHQGEVVILEKLLQETGIGVPGRPDNDFVYEPFKDATAPRIQPQIEPPFYSKGDQEICVPPDRAASRSQPDFELLLNEGYALPFPPDNKANEGVSVPPNAASGDVSITKGKAR